MLSEAALRGVYEEVVEIAKSFINEKQVEAPPMLLMFKLGEPKNHLLGLVDPQLVSELQSSGLKKTIMMFLIDETLNGRGPGQKDSGLPTPDLVVHVTEAWTLAASSKEELDRKRGDNKSLENVEGRQESLLVNMHTKDEGTYFQQIQIRSANGKRSIDPPPFDYGNRRYNVVKGRLIRKPTTSQGPLQ